MTKERLKYLEELCNDATPGPWQGAESDDKCSAAVNAPKGDPRMGCSSWSEMVTVHGSEDAPRAGLKVADDNARFIAEARTAMPELIEEIYRLRAHIEDGRFYGRD